VTGEEGPVDRDLKFEILGGIERANSTQVELE
jgi:hypothetical protein